MLSAYGSMVRKRRYKSLLTSTHDACTSPSATHSLRQDLGRPCHVCRCTAIAVVAVANLLDRDTQEDGPSLIYVDRCVRSMLRGRGLTNINIVCIVAISSTRCAVHRRSKDCSWQFQWQ